MTVLSWVDIFLQPQNITINVTATCSLLIYLFKNRPYIYLDSRIIWYTVYQALIHMKENLSFTWALETQGSFNVQHSNYQERASASGLLLAFGGYPHFFKDLTKKGEPTSTTHHEIFIKGVLLKESISLPWAYSFWLHQGESWILAS